MASHFPFTNKAFPKRKVRLYSSHSGISDSSHSDNLKLPSAYTRTHLTRTPVKGIVVDGFFVVLVELIGLHHLDIGILDVRFHPLA